MTARNVMILTTGAVLLLLILPSMASATGAGSYNNFLIPFLQEWETFKPNPYWDVSRYSWGYGTPAPGATGTISESQAINDMVDHTSSDFDTLDSLVTRDLNGKQWAALLSFSYNLGVGNAQKLLPNINSGDDVALGMQWNRYVYAGGARSDNLVQRRAAEWQLWNS